LISSKTPGNIEQITIIQSLPTGFLVCHPDICVQIRLRDLRHSELDNHECVSIIPAAIAKKIAYLNGCGLSVHRRSQKVDRRPRASVSRNNPSCAQVPPASVLNPPNYSSSFIHKRMITAKQLQYSKGNRKNRAGYQILACPQIAQEVVTDINDRSVVK
jgi:hypothetical protein